MSARAASFALLLSALVVLSTRPALADAWLLAPGEHRATLTGDFHHTETFHDAAGNRLGLPGFNSLEERTVFYRSQIGWLGGTNLMWQLPWRTISSVNERGTLPDTTDSNSGFGDFVLGFQQALVGGTNGRTVVSLEGRWEVPLGYEARGTYAWLGPDQQTVVGLLHFGQSLPALRGFVQVSGGYRYMFDTFADQMLGSADLVLGVTNALQLGGRWRGSVASGDAEVGGLEVTEHLVGPVLVYRVDDRLDLRAGSWHTAAGENVIHRNQIYVGLLLKQTRLDRTQGSGFLGGARLP